MVVGEPALVGVVDVLVGLARDHDRVELVGHVEDRQRVFVIVEAELGAGEVGVGAVVVDALDVMAVAVLGDAANVRLREHPIVTPARGVQKK